MSARTMPEEGFLRRWARLKSAPDDARPEAPATGTAPPDEAAAPHDGAVRPAAPAADAAPPARALPTLDDVARLTPESDYSAFVAQGVDKTVQRMALKKLFADPNFAVMDGLDIYIADYNKASPLSDAMLATLRHAPGVLGRLLGEDEQAAHGAAPHTAAAAAAADPDGIASGSAPSGAPADGAAPPPQKPEPGTA